jgi:hypothetical protein
MKLDQKFSEYADIFNVVNHILIDEDLYRKWISDKSNLNACLMMHL